MRRAFPVACAERRYGRLAPAEHRRLAAVDHWFRDGAAAVGWKGRAMSLVDQIISWAFLIGVLLLPPLAIASLWLWGGARRGALGHFMAGALLLVSGAVFYFVRAINVFA